MLLEAYIACTGNEGTVQLTTNFKKIWFCMHGIMLGARSPFSLYFICFQIIIINYAKTMDLFVLCKLKNINFIVNILMWINIVKKLEENKKYDHLRTEMGTPLGTLTHPNGYGPPAYPQAQQWSKSDTHDVLNGRGLPA
jgi:hypothetical protein